MLKPILGLTSLIFGFGVASAQVSAAFEEEAKAAIEEMRLIFEANAGAADPSPLFPMLRPDTTMVSPGGEVWDRIRSDAEGQGRPFPLGFEIAITPRETVIMSEEWAYDFGTSKVTYTPEGEEPLEAQNTYLLLFRNDGEGWKLYREAASLRAPPGGF